MRGMRIMAMKVDVPRMVDVHYGGFSCPASEKLEILENVKDVLEGLLGYAISAEAVGRTQCVQHILSLDKSHQQQLKAIIEEQMLKRAAMQEDEEEEHDEAQDTKDTTSATDEVVEDVSGAAGEQGEVLLLSSYNFIYCSIHDLFIPVPIASSLTLLHVLLLAGSACSRWRSCACIAQAGFRPKRPGVEARGGESIGG